MDVDIMDKQDLLQELTKTQEHAKEIREQYKHHAPLLNAL
jgi:hypothetical protein